MSFRRRLSRISWKLTARLAFVLLIGLALMYACFTRRDFPTGFTTPTEAYAIPPIIAHMGSGTSAPGNTLEAARQLLGSEIGGLEMDVQLSADGVPMIFHDTTLDTGSTGHGTVAARKASELTTLRLVVDGRVTDHPIPTLDQMFALVGSARFLFLDIKDSGLRDTGMARALCDLIKGHDLYRTVIVESFNPVFLRRMRNLDSRVRIMFDFADEAVATSEESPEQLAEIPWFLKQEWIRSGLRGWIQPDLLGPRQTVSVERLRALAARGYPMVAWTIDDPDRAAALFAVGVVAVESNVPLQLSASLAGRVPRVLDDASRLNRTVVSGVIRVGTEADIHLALERARTLGMHVSIAGSRHSMGGQSFGPDHLVLDMTSLKDMSLDSNTEVLTVQSGAIWSDVQKFLDPRGRAVKVMQSDTIFTVGGTLSVNAHGWQPNSAPIVSTVKSFRVMLASGELLTCSREQNAGLFAAVLGGYGLLGVILDARLETVPNELYRKVSYFFPMSEYPEMFRRHVADNPRAGLSYGRLSVHGTRPFSEAGLHVYERILPRSLTLPAMEEEALVSLKRNIFRSSERSDIAKRRRWLMEKEVGPKLESGAITRNTAMHPDPHLMWPEDPDKRDILQEYFIPRSSFRQFVDGAARLIRSHGQNLLNVTIRDVRQDNDTLLAYSKTDSFSLVFLFSQDATPGGESTMQDMTRELIDLALGLKGSFYLTYRLHFSREQFHKAYPRSQEFLEVKRKYDENTLFSSWFYRHITGEQQDK